MVSHVPAAVEAAGRGLREAGQRQRQRLASRSLQWGAAAAAADAEEAAAGEAAAAAAAAGAIVEAGA